MKLKVGDRVRIIGVPGGPGLETPNCTIRAFKKLIERGRPVRINRIDDGVPWFDCRFLKRGRWEYHTIALLPGEEHLWRKVKERK